MRKMNQLWMDISLWCTKWVDVAQCLTFVSLLILYTMVWLLLVFLKICRVVPAWGKLKYMTLSYFMKGTSIRCFWLLDYVGASADLSNGLCLVQIWWFFVDIQSKVMSMENWTRMANFVLPLQGKKLADNFLVQGFFFISLCRVKLEPQVRAQTIGNYLLDNNNECH
jgi:hypothetical protein